MSAGTASDISSFVLRAAALFAAAAGLAAAFVLPLRLGSSASARVTARMPESRHVTTVSIHPAPGRPESSPLPPVVFGAP